MPENSAHKLHSVAVYCGSSAGLHEDYICAAETLGRLLAKEGIKLVYGGGRRGLMGHLADAALAEGGEVVGVIPRFMMELEWGHPGVTRLIQVESMAARKEKMFALADALIALPGGVGTLEEFSEVLSASQLLLHRKALGFLNTDGYYDLFFQFMEHMREEGFCSENTMNLWISDADAEGLLHKIAVFHHHGLGKTFG